MSHALLHHPGNIVLTCVGLVILAASFQVYSDTNQYTNSYNSDYSLNEYEANPHTINNPWLEEGGQVTSHYAEGDAAFQELAENMLKKYWVALVHRDQHYDRYSPLVTGYSSIDRSDVNVGLRFSGSTVKLRFEYSF